MVFSCTGFRWTMSDSAVLVPNREVNKIAMEGEYKAAHTAWCVRILGKLPCMHFYGARWFKLVGHAHIELQLLLATSLYVLTQLRGRGAAVLWNDGRGLIHLYIPSAPVGVVGIQHHYDSAYKLFGVRCQLFVVIPSSCIICNGNIALWYYCRRQLLAAFMSFWRLGHEQVRVWRSERTQDQIQQWMRRTSRDLAQNRYRPVC